MAKRFPYYARLSDRDKRIYRRSDAIAVVELPDAAALRSLVAALETTLEEGKRVRVARAVEALSRALFAQLGVSMVQVRVREVRPDIGGAELYGQYTFATEDKIPIIEVWMRTLARGRVVKFKTFLRTLLHEMVHHLDVTLFELGESFHTAGFFRRESSLVKQLLDPKAFREAQRPELDAPTKPPARTRRSSAKGETAQLGLFDSLDREPLKRKESQKPRRGDRSREKRTSAKLGNDDAS